MEAAEGVAVQVVMSLTEKGVMVAAALVALD